jgi:hypothetical protein
MKNDLVCQISISYKMLDINYVYYGLKGCMNWENKKTNLTGGNAY